jgi:hypothetical protein
MMGLVSPRRNTPWMEFLSLPRVRAIGASYSLAKPEISRAVARHAKFAEGEDVDLILYGMQHHWDAAALPKVVRELKRYGLGDLRAMARSFLFRNCSVHAAKREIVQRRASEVATINKRLARGER